MFAAAPRAELTAARLIGGPPPTAAVLEGNLALALAEAGLLAGADEAGGLQGAAGLEVAEVSAGLEVAAEANCGGAAGDGRAEGAVAAGLDAALFLALAVLASADADAGVADAMNAAAYAVIVGGAATLAGAEDGLLTDGVGVGIVAVACLAAAGAGVVDGAEGSDFLSIRCEDKRKIAQSSAPPRLASNMLPMTPQVVRSSNKGLERSAWNRSHKTCRSDFSTQLAKSIPRSVIIALSSLAL